MAVSVTSKGQVTNPKRVRDALGITPGSKVEFDVAGVEPQAAVQAPRADQVIERREHKVAS
jgi:antitoxin PrlF